MATSEQRKAWNKKYYEKNKKERREQYNKFRKETREWYRELKNQLVCARCGFDHPAALQFHHKDATLKTSEVAAMIGQGLSRQTILDEIEKCEVLCANCHAIEHWQKKHL